MCVVAVPLDSASYCTYIVAESDAATVAVLSVGLAAYASVFAVNSSVHSYLIVSYSNKVLFVDIRWSVPYGMLLEKCACDPRNVDRKVGLVCIDRRISLAEASVAFTDASRETDLAPPLERTAKSRRRRRKGRRKKELLQFIVMECSSMP